MPISCFDATIKPINQAIESLRNIMRFGQKYAQQQGIDEASLLEKRLFADMFELRGQIYLLQLLAVNQGALRVLEITPSTKAAPCGTFAEIDELLSGLIDDLDRIDPDAFERRMNEPVHCDLPIGPTTFPVAKDYMLQWVLPHTYFHVTTAYNILRNNGVPLTKGNFLGPVAMKVQSDPQPK